MNGRITSGCSLIVLLVKVVTIYELNIDLLWFSLKRERASFEIIARLAISVHYALDMQLNFSRCVCVWHRHHDRRKPWILSTLNHTRIHLCRHNSLKGTRLSRHKYPLMSMRLLFLSQSAQMIQVTHYNSLLVRHRTAPNSPLPTKIAQFHCILNLMTIEEKQCYKTYAESRIASYKLLNVIAVSVLLSHFWFMCMYLALDSNRCNIFVGIFFFGAQTFIFYAISFIATRSLSPSRSVIAFGMV